MAGIYFCQLLTTGEAQNPCYGDFECDLSPIISDDRTTPLPRL